jgi:predicted DNA-binding transcriptional regulator AlpA
VSTDRRALATKAEVAAFLQKPEHTLDQWRYLGRGPKAIKVGRTLRYRWSDVEAWLNELAAAGGDSAALQATRPARGSSLPPGRPKRRYSQHRQHHASALVRLPVYLQSRAA